MKELYEEFIDQLYDYRKHVAFDNSSAAEDVKDRLVLIFFQACMTDFKSEVIK